MIHFLLKQIFCGNLNESISLVETAVTLKVNSVVNGIVSFRFPQKIFLKKELTFRIKMIE